MTEKAHEPQTQAALFHNRELLLAISRASHDIQRAQSEQDVYRAVENSIKSLGGEITLFMINDDRRTLSIVYTSYSESLLRKAEKITGLSLQHYPIPFSANSVYGSVMEGGRAVYVDSTSQAISEILPPSLRLFVLPLTAMFDLQQGILSPLLVDGDAMGLFKVNGSFLNEDDLLAIDSFAAQIAVGLRNVRLMQKLQDELKARREAQEALASSEAELRALFASMQDTVLVIDRNGMYRSIAPTHPGKLYIPPENVIGKHLSDIFPVEQTRKFFDLIQQVLDTRQTMQIEYQILLDGDGPWFESSVSPMGTDTTLWVARDITERRKIVTALAQSETAYRSLFENIPIGLYRTSVDGQFLDANPALVKMFGYPDLASLLARDTVEMYVDPDRHAEFKRKISKGGVISSFEAEFRRCDQSVFWAEDHGHIIYDAQGAPLHYEGSLIDITERKKVEHELRLANTSLAAAHREIQQALAYEQVLARTDGLTGLYNRRYFHKLAAREFSAAIRHLHPLTIILFDVDGFKQVNDSYGHDVGDRVLIQVAQSTASHVREVDVLARYGGDEFIVLFPETSAQDVFQIAERIRRGVEEMRVFVDGEALSVTISVGVAEIDHASQSKSVEDIIRHADKALYRVKQNGSNHTVVFKLNSTGDKSQFSQLFF